jgi:D-beta-D-heptose 7-phosphate kinase / D-beta-D-heptose 1-phosphate adenosyltransferase
MCIGEYRCTARVMKRCELAEANRQQSHLEQAMFLTESWRRRGETVVFTNGCFDVLHRGHLWLFEQAHALGRHLIIAVNSDEYVRRVKGPGRPVQPSCLRRQIVQAVARAHVVLPLEDDNPEAMLKVLRPDVYIVGSDYRDQPLAGSEYCGQVVFVERLAEFSTTNSLRALQTEAFRPD